MYSENATAHENYDVKWLSNMMRHLKVQSGNTFTQRSIKGNLFIFIIASVTQTGY